MMMMMSKLQTDTIERVQLSNLFIKHDCKCSGKVITTNRKKKMIKLLYFKQHWEHCVWHLSQFHTPSPKVLSKDRVPVTLSLSVSCFSVALLCWPLTQWNIYQCTSKQIWWFMA